MSRRRLLSVIAIALPVLLVFGAGAIVLTSWLDHRRLVEEERAAYPAPGELVAVGTGPSEAGGLLHVYAEGQGAPTLVFLAGLGTSSPHFDFKTLFERLAQDYRVAVVERAGYGWSDVTDSPRDIATVLEDSRTALMKADESPPFVLFPHSMAGLEAAYWAMEHPDEVEAIIGLDPLVQSCLEPRQRDRAFRTLEIGRHQRIEANDRLHRVRMLHCPVGGLKTGHGMRKQHEWRALAGLHQRGAGVFQNRRDVAGAVGDVAPAVAGTFDDGDAVVLCEPFEKGLEVEMGRTRPETREKDERRRPLPFGVDMQKTAGLRRPGSDRDELARGRVCRALFFHEAPVVEPARQHDRAGAEDQQNRQGDCDDGEQSAAGHGRF